jgi:(p)ppGpp synthase/HD superfamily hydrolase
MGNQKKDKDGVDLTSAAFAFKAPVNPNIIKAFEMAIKAHGNQTYGPHPYSYHLNKVYEVLIRFGFDENDIDHLDLLIACPLHDSLEDTAISYTDIKKTFNEDIAEIVFCMTDDKNGKTRKEKKDLTYPKLATNPDSIVLKLADRIANMENAEVAAKEKDEKDFGKMYMKEFKKFRWMLYRPGHADEMWAYLDRLVNMRKAKLGA